MLSVNFPLVSNERSAFAASTSNSVILPACEPDIIYLSSGLKATVHRSTGPTSIVDFFSPVSKSQTLILESKELEAHTESLIRTKKFLTKKLVLT